MEDMNLRKFPSAFMKEISLGSLPVNLETFSTDRSQELNPSQLSPIYVFKSFIYQSTELCCCTCYKVVIILFWASSKWDILSMFDVVYVDTVLCHICVTFVEIYVGDCKKTYVGTWYVIDSFIAYCSLCIVGDVLPR